MRRRVLIMGAGGRDFHNFNVVFRNDAACEVVAFTAAQIPYTAGRTCPHALAGPLYPYGIPIYPEEDLDTLLSTCGIGQTVFAYSDVSHEEPCTLLRDAFPSAAISYFSVPKGRCSRRSCRSSPSVP